MNNNMDILLYSLKNLFSQLHNVLVIVFLHLKLIQLITILCRKHFSKRINKTMFHHNATNAKFM